MELALPHLVVRVCGPGVGADLVAALGVHPVEVSETHDNWESGRVAGGRPALLVVVLDPPDARSAVVETWAAFPRVPILIISDLTKLVVPSEDGLRGWVDTVRSSQPVQDLCWLVLEAASRAAHVPGIAEHPLGPHRIDVDQQGLVLAATMTPDVAIATFLQLQSGDSLPSLVAPLDRDTIATAIERAHAGVVQFCTVRLLDEHGHCHIVALGLRGIGEDRITVLAQPLISGGPIVGRHANDRDPVTGLLTRWAVSRALEPREYVAGAAVILISLDDFAAISGHIGYRQTDLVLLSVASALEQIFPHPALTCRLMGDCFLTSMVQSESGEALHRAERLLGILGGIDVPGFAPPFPLRASIGVAALDGDDHDLAIRLAEAASAAARAAGGHRAVVVGTKEFTCAQARDLTASMDLGSWEVWLQPVVRHGCGRATFHEALARFDGARRPLASRADFFMVGRAKGLLERFDRMMLQRSLELLESHPDERLSVNVSFETFSSATFPASFLDLIHRVPDGCSRVILEITSRSIASPEALVRPRLESLAAAGVRVALDDFGSGICRLRHLTQWPLAIVKLDQLVTGYVNYDPLQRELLRTVASICRARGITTVAEYTRSEEQLARLVADGIDLFQGELFGMPRPAADVLRPSAVEPVTSAS